MARKLTLVTDNVSPSAVRRKQRSARRRLRRWVVISAMGLFFGGLSFVTYSDRLADLREAESTYAEYEEQYEQLLQQEEYFRDQISKLESEEYVAQLARERYFKSEEGEIIFKLPDSSEELQLNSTEDE